MELLSLPTAQDQLLKDGGQSIAKTEKISQRSLRLRGRRWAPGGPGRRGPGSPTAVQPGARRAALLKEVGELPALLQDVVGAGDSLPAPQLVKFGVRPQTFKQETHAFLEHKTPSAPRPCQLPTAAEIVRSEALRALAGARRDLRIRMETPAGFLARGTGLDFYSQGN